MNAKRCLVCQVILSALVVAGCSAVGLPNVPVRASGGAVHPDVRTVPDSDAPVTEFASWQSSAAPALRTRFQALIYGAMPLGHEVTRVEQTPLDLPFDNVGQAEQWTLRIGTQEADLKLHMVVIRPKVSPAQTKPVPMVVLQNFCGNALALAGAASVSGPRYGVPKECRNSLMLPFVPLVFGGAIVQPPIARIVASGHGVAMMYAGDIVPDDPVLAEPILQRLTPAGTPAGQRTGAIAAWAWTYLRALDALGQDVRIDPSRLVLWGHSRNGKAALLAAAMDPRPAGVIALQSGTAGASLSQDDIGESVAKITEVYPHWFAPDFASWSGRQDTLPVDQHQLLALIAPRPILLGAGRRDQWSDPQGGVRAARAASPIYEMAGSKAFVQTDLRKPDFEPQIVTYMRPGLHGIHDEDWTMALRFLDRKLVPVEPH